MHVDWIIIAVFAAVYAGMALGRWPGLAVDRTGVAMIGVPVTLLSLAAAWLWMAFLHPLIAPLLGV